MNSTQLTQIRQIKQHATCIGDRTHERATFDCFAVEFNIDIMRFSDFGCERNQTASATNDLNMIRHFAFVDRYFQLAFARRTCIHCNAFEVV